MSRVQPVNAACCTFEIWIPAFRLLVRKSAEKCGKVQKPPQRLEAEAQVPGCPLRFLPEVAGLFSVQEVCGVFAEGLGQGIEHAVAKTVVGKQVVAFGPLVPARDGEDRWRLGVFV